MSLIVYSKQASQVTVGADSDRVVAAVTIPRGCELVRAWFNQHVLVHGQAITNLFFYGVKGMITDLLDDDAATGYDSIWDAKVPKDTTASSGSLDLDTEGLVTAAEFDLGQPDMQSVYDMTIGQEFFRRRKMISFATSPIGYEGGGEDTYTAADSWSSPVNIKYKCPMERNQAAMLGFSSPGLVETTASIASFDEKELVFIRYLEWTMQQAMMSLIGLTESTAETPWIEAQSAIASFLEPAVYDQSGGLNFAATTWEVVTQATFMLKVTGDMERAVLSGG